MKARYFDQKEKILRRQIRTVCRRSVDESLSEKEFAVFYELNNHLARVQVQKQLIELKVVLRYLEHMDIGRSQMILQSIEDIKKRMKELSENEPFMNSKCVHEWVLFEGRCVGCMMCKIPLKQQDMNERGDVYAPF